MAENFLSLAFTPAVLSAQACAYGRAWPTPTASAPDRLGEEEQRFIRSRDSFYLSSITETGWPYIQHRGGPSGFVHVLDNQTLAFADLRGNRQLITTGNLTQNNRVALFFMDYPRRERLKLLGHAHVKTRDEAPVLARRFLASEGPPPERIFTIEVVAFDWNCPKYITPRYTADEVARVTQPLRDRITQLEAALAATQGHPKNSSS